MKVYVVRYNAGVINPDWEIFCICSTKEQAESRVKDCKSVMRSYDPEDFVIEEWDVEE